MEKKVLATEEMMRQAGEASRRRLWTHTVAVINGNRVVNLSKKYDAEGFGTGLAAKWGNHHFILTAKHVLKGAKSSELRIFWYPGGAIESKKPEQLGKGDVLDGKPLSDAASEIRLCSWEDLAVITVPPGAIGEGAEYIDLTKDWFDPPSGERVHCFGFPSDSGFVWDTRVVKGKTDKTLAIYPGIFDGQVIAKPPFPTNDFSEELHFLIPFERTKEGKAPYGYSGCAAWWESDKMPAVCRPNFKFAGTCTSWYPNAALEKVVKASVALKFIKEAFVKAA